MEKIAATNADLQKVLVIPRKARKINTAATAWSATLVR